MDLSRGAVTDLLDPGALQAASNPLEVSLPSGQRRRSPGRLLHPLTAICAVQAGLSLTLVWSNTAFTDEAEYLWGGQLEISHWLHGTPLPATLTHNFSGSPVIYPPIGALADTVSGLAGARILSMVFMLIATILLYNVAKQLFGNTAALFAAALWAVSEPTIRLGAFATYDALSILLTTLSVWLAVQAGHLKHRGEFVAASALSLALANATAYLSVVIDPVVIVFAFLVWLPATGPRQARFCRAWFVAGWVVAFAALMTALHSWPGIAYTFTRVTTHGYNSFALILNNLWTYSGLYILLAIVGAITSKFTENRDKRALVIMLASASLVAPAAQITAFSQVSLDKPFAYGLWFAVMAAGYGCSKLLNWFPAGRRIPAILCCGLALAYPAADNWQAAWYRQLSWSNSSSFVAAFGPVVARSDGFIDASTQSFVAEYYLPQGRDWTRWNADQLPLDPSGVPKNAWEAYYSKLLRQTGNSVIALFYTTTVPGFPQNVLLSSGAVIARQQLQKIVASDTGGTQSSLQGLPAFTVALDHDATYRLVAVGPYDTNLAKGVYAIWQKKAES
jgi:Dolichyl-phosphate-mannose-protein mannosyltransferase